MVATLTSAVGKNASNPGLLIPNRPQDVLKVQQLLNLVHVKTGTPKKRIAEDSRIGPETVGAICEFQKATFGWQDGVIEPDRDTLRRLAALADGPGKGGGPGPGGAGLAEQAVQIALGENGVRESPLGSNGGPRVDEYLRAVGLNHPDLWCMAFVYWCFKQAADRSGVAVPLTRTASCTQLYAWARTNGKLATPPLRGDVFLVRGGAAGRTHQHTGIVTSVSGVQVGTIEGNTNNDGSRNGIGVFIRSRGAASLDYVRV